MIRAIRSGLAAVVPPDAHDEGRYAYRLDGDMRVVQVPGEAAVLGVEGDRGTNRVSFRLPREYRGTDLSAFSVQVSYANAGGELGVYDAGKPTVEADGLSFEWLVEEPVTRYVGAVRFAAKLYQADERGTVLRQYSSTVGTAQCLEGLDVDAELPEDVAKSLIAQLTGLTEASAKRANDAASKAEAAAGKADEAAKRAFDAASKAAGNILRGEASGTLAHADDAFPAKPLGWTVYGRSVQDGTPSPDAPKPIASVTEAALKACGKNICSDDELTNVNWAKSLPEIARMLNRLKDRPVSITFTATLVSADDETKVPNSMFGMTVKGRKVYADQKPWGDGARIGTTKTIVYSFTVAPDDEITNVWAYGCGNSNDSSQRTNGRANISIQIELGTAATAYEPYQGSNLAIDLAGHELRSLPNGVRDELRIDEQGSVELVKRTWTLRKRIGDMNNASNYPGWVIPFSEMTCPLESGYDAQIMGFSTHFHRFYGRYIESQTEWLIYTMNIGMTESELVARYPDEVVTLVGELATPEVIPLGAVELPTLPAPVCNAWVESDVPTECGLRYVRDVNIVIARLEKQLAAVAGAVSMLDVPTVIPELSE